jgi:hypothetical protein
MSDIERYTGEIERHGGREVEAFSGGSRVARTGFSVFGIRERLFSGDGPVADYDVDEFLSGFDRRTTGFGRREFSPGGRDGPEFVDAYSGEDEVLSGHRRIGERRRFGRGRFMLDHAMVEGDEPAELRGGRRGIGRVGLRRSLERELTRTSTPQLGSGAGIRALGDGDSSVSTRESPPRAALAPPEHSSDAREGREIIDATSAVVPRVAGELNS